MKKTLFLLIIVSVCSIEATAKPTKLNDSQIISVVIAANQADLSIGHLVRSKSTDNEVSYYAQRMVTDHSINLESVASLLIKLKIKPEDSSTSQNFIVRNMRNITELNSLPQTKFNKTYINQRIIFHAQVLEAVDRLLIPNAKNKELKQLLEKIRPAFDSHLQHAKRVQKYLNKQKL